MVITYFQVQNKLKKTRFFKKIFLVPDTSMEVVFGLFFLNFSNINMVFVEKKLTWRTYTLQKSYLILKKSRFLIRGICNSGT